MMHGREKSDSAIVAGKPTNKAGQPAAEPVEPRAEAKGNASQQSTRRTQSRVSVSHALERIRQTLCRYTPKVGAVCPNWARTDLCGGRSVMSVPTAIDVTGFAANPTRLARRSIRVLDVGLRTVAAGGRLGVPVAFLVLVFDALRVPGHALLGGGRARRRERRIVGRKRLREHAVDCIGPAVVVANDPICDMRHGCTCCWQRSIWRGVPQHRSAISDVSA